MSETTLGTLANGISSSGPSPCPVLNMLHKAGHLPSKGITHATTSTALLNIGLAPSLAGLLSTNALHKVGTRDKTFDLVALRTHNIIEHDGSLTRLDTWTGNNWMFHQDTWTQSLQLLGGKSDISIAHLSQMRLGAIDAARRKAEAQEGAFEFGLSREWVSLIQWAMIFYCLSAGSGRLKVADLDWFMTHEKLPPEFVLPSKRLSVFGLFTGPFLKLAVLSLRHRIENRMKTLLTRLHLRSGAAASNCKTL